MLDNAPPPDRLDSMFGRLHTTLCIVAAVSLAQLTYGAAPSQTEVEAWFDMARRQPPRFPLAPPWVATLTRETSTVVTAQEVADLREIVKGHPEHPLRSSLADKERWLKYGPDEAVFELWYLDEHTWRIRQDPATKYGPKEPGDPIRQFTRDVGRTDGRTWSVWNSGLEIDQGAARAVVLASLHSVVRQLFDPQLAALTRDMQPRTLTFSETKTGWDISFARAEDRESSVSVAWDDATHTGRVLRMSTRVRSNPGSTPTGVLDGWVQDEWGTHATVLYQTDASTSQQTKSTLTGLRACTADEVRARAAVPVDGQADPARGKVNLRYITDRVADEQWAKVPSSTGGPPTMERQHIGVPTLASKGYSSLTAWLTASAACGAALAIVWLKRRAA